MIWDIDKLIIEQKLWVYAFKCRYVHSNHIFGELIWLKTRLLCTHWAVHSYGIFWANKILSRLYLTNWTQQRKLWKPIQLKGNWKYFPNTMYMYKSRVPLMMIAAVVIVELTVELTVCWVCLYILQFVSLIKWWIGLNPISSFIECTWQKPGTRGMAGVVNNWGGA